MKNTISSPKLQSFPVLKLVSVLVITLFFSQISHTQTPAVWTNYVQSIENGTQPILPDYSFSGYKFSEEDLPDVSGYTYFDVTDYGAIANDTGYDDDPIQATIDAAVASGNPAVVFFLLDNTKSAATMM